MHICLTHNPSSRESTEAKIIAMATLGPQHPHPTSQHSMGPILPVVA